MQLASPADQLLACDRQADGMCTHRVVYPRQTCSTSLSVQAVGGLCLQTVSKVTMMQLMALRKGSSRLISCTCADQV